MTRLIDADDLDSVVLQMNTKENAQITRGEYKLIDSVLFEFPTIDAEPVRHGKWIFESICGRHAVMTCSECRKMQDGQTLCFTYCPNCGARMDKDD